MLIVLQSIVDFCSPLHFGRAVAAFRGALPSLPLYLALERRLWSFINSRTIIDKNITIHVELKEVN